MTSPSPNPQSGIQPEASAGLIDAQPLRVVVLASGQGTLLQSLVDNLDAQRAQIVAVGSDKHCPALDRAQAAGIETFCQPFDQAARENRLRWNQQLAAAIEKHQPDIVVSAGFMRILGAPVLEAFPDRIINTHPALLPSFPGAHAVADALAYGVTISGTTVHLVDAGVDTGPIIAQRAVPVANDDTEATLHERIKIAERQLLVDVIHIIAERELIRDGRKVRFS